MRHFLGFPETLHFWSLGTEKYPGILVMNFSLGFIQLKVVPLNFPSEKCHVIHHPCYSSSHPRWLLGFPFTHRTLNWLPSNAVHSMSSSSMVLPFPHHHLPHRGSSQLLPPPWSPCFLSPVQFRLPRSRENNESKAQLLLFLTYFRKLCAKPDWEKYLKIQT